MLVLRSLVAKMLALKMSFLASFKDMANAFACTADQERRQTVQELVPPDDGPNYRRAHADLFLQRVVNSIVQLFGYDGSAAYLPKVGNCIGTSEGPKLFARAYARFVER